MNANCQTYRSYFKSVFANVYTNTMVKGKIGQTISPRGADIDRVWDDRLGISSEGK